MARVKFNQDTPDDKGEPQAAGQQAFSAEDVAAIVAQAVAKTGVNGGSVDAPPPQAAKPIEEQIGLSDSQVAAMKESMGEAGYEGFIRTMTAQRDDQNSMMSALLDLFERGQKAQQEQMSDLSGKLEQVSKVDPDREWGARGYGVFERHQDDLHEMLKEMSNDVVDMVGKFEKAQEGDLDYEFLDAVKPALEKRIASQQKRHIGAGGTGHVLFSETEREQAEKEEKEYQEKRAAANALNGAERFEALEKLHAERDAERASN